MKKYLFLLLVAVSISSAIFSQTCTNCGFGINTALSKIHIKGCGVDSLTSSLRATDSSGNVVLFVRDDKRVGINTKYPKSALDITSTTSGILIPRMTKTQRDAITSPATGLLIYQTDNTPGFYYYNSSAWTSFSTNSWGIIGNTGTTASNFLGSTDNVSLRIRTNNTQKVIIDSLGKVGVGTNSPSFKLELSGTSSIADRTMAINTIPLVYLPDQNGSVLYGSVAFGNGMRSLTSGSGKYNTAAGIEALMSNTSGNNNTAVGFESLYYNTSGTRNTSVGAFALITNVSGAGNSAFGKSALYYNTASNNTAVGAQSLLTNSSGSENTATGVNAMYSNTTGGNNTAVGVNTLYTNSTGSDNTAIGHSTLYANNGNFNSAVGRSALTSNTTGSSNSAFGYNSMNSNTSGNSNAAAGVGAMYSNTTGSYNAALGDNALYSNTSGSYNVALGHYALFGNTGGNYNIACGAYALQYNTTGTSNFANGVNALQANTTGSNNSAEGYQTLTANKTGDSNTANGYQSLNADTSGSNNTGMGTQTLYLNKNGNYNTSLGYRAGYDVTTGSNNTFLGPFPTTGSGITTGSNNVLIGYDVRSGLSQTTSNQLNIGNLIFGTGLGSGNTLSTGNIGIGTSSPVTNAKLAIKDGHLQSQQTTAPTVAATNAGTSPSVSLSNATDVAGKIALTTGTGSPGTGAYVTVTFNKSHTTAPVVVIYPSNATAATNIASKGIYVSSTTTTFVINFNAAAGTSETYNWTYLVVETQ